MNLLHPIPFVAVVGEDFPKAGIELLKKKGVDLTGLEIVPGKTFHWEGRYSPDLTSRESLATELGAVTLVGTTPFAIVVNAATPVRNIAEWIAYARARPGQLRFGSTGMYGSMHMCMEKFNAINGLKLTHVPYKSAVPAMTDLIAGEIHVSCPAVPMLPPYLKAGRIRALGVTYPEPTRLLADVPPVSHVANRRRRTESSVRHRRRGPEGQ